MDWSYWSLRLLTCTPKHEESVRSLEGRGIFFLSSVSASPAESPLIDAPHRAECPPQLESSGPDPLWTRHFILLTDGLAIAALSPLNPPTTSRGTAAGRDPDNCHGILEPGVQQQPADRFSTASKQLPQRIARCLLLRAGSTEQNLPGLPCSNNVQEMAPSPLAVAAWAGDTAEVRRLLAGGADVKAKGAERTALQWAASKGHEGVVTMLLDAGANVEARETDGITALQLAAMNGREGTVRLLLDLGADLAATCNDGRGALHLAAEEGRVGTVSLLLDAGADVESMGSGGKTPLLWAAFSGHEVLVRVLLAAGAEVLAKDSNGWSSLHWGAYFAEAGTVRLLLDAGADVAATAIDGTQPLHEAGCDSVARMLLDASANVAARNNAGQMPLHCAAQEGDAELVRVLLDAGADFSSQDNQGRTPLHHATIMDNMEGVEASERRQGVVRVLLHAGADGEVKDGAGASPEDRAAASDHLEVHPHVRFGPLFSRAVVLCVRSSSRATHQRRRLNHG